MRLPDLNTIITEISICEVDYHLDTIINEISLSNCAWLQQTYYYYEIILFGPKIFFLFLMSDVIWSWEKLKMQNIISIIAWNLELMFA